MRLLADDGINQLFGTIAPPISTIPEEPTDAIGSLIGLGIKIFITVAGITVLIMLLWGAYDWITSGGDKEKLTKAQQKITNAIIGIFVVVVVLSVFCVVTVDILKISNSCLNFTIPTL